VLYYSLVDHPEKIKEFLRYSPQGKVPLIIREKEMRIGFGGT
jgi:glutathione S-transferase